MRKQIFARKSVNFLLWNKIVFAELFIRKVIVRKIKKQRILALGKLIEKLGLHIAIQT